MFTLTAITLERWHTITHALQRDRRLGLRQACLLMAAGWTFSCVSAALPTLGVSSYSKVRTPPGLRVLQGLGPNQMGPGPGPEGSRTRAPGLELNVDRQRARS